MFKFNLNHAFQVVLVLEPFICRKINFSKYQAGILQPILWEWSRYLYLIANSLKDTIDCKEFHFYDRLFAERSMLANMQLEMLQSTSLKWPCDKILSNVKQKMLQSTFFKWSLASHLNVNILIEQIYNYCLNLIGVVDLKQPPF